MAPWETGPITMPSEAQAPASPAPEVPRPRPLPTPHARTRTRPVRAPTPGWTPSLPPPPAAARAPGEAPPPEPPGPGPTARSPRAAAAGFRQASLAPQLRAREGADARGQQGQPGQPDPWPVEDEDPGFGVRSPEATRSMFTMMQHGWRRGRMDDLNDPEGATGSGN